MQDKRKLQRFDLKVPTKIEGIGNRKDRPILDLMTSDICAGGAFFHTDRHLPEGTKVKLDLVLSLGGIRKFLSDYDYAHIKVTGRVIRNEPRGMAVCFNRDYSIQPRKGREAIQN